jgi:hypothetical protein
VLKGDSLSAARHEVVKAHGHCGIEVAPKATPTNTQKVSRQKLRIDAR